MLEYLEIQNKIEEEMMAVEQLDVPDSYRYLILRTRMQRIADYCSKQFEAQEAAILSRFKDEHIHS